MRIKTLDVVICLSSFVLAILRIAGFKHEFFQACAHLYIGNLIGYWVCLKHIIPVAIEDERTEEVIFWNVVVLSLVEIACFVLLK